AFFFIDFDEVLKEGVMERHVIKDGINRVEQKLEHSPQTYVVRHRKRNPIRVGFHELLDKLSVGHTSAFPTTITPNTRRSNNAVSSFRSAGTSTSMMLSIR